MKPRTVATHNGDFHTDEIFAVAILSLALGKDAPISVLRTRDEGEIKKAEYVVDVGGVYDESAKRFDHHQGGGAGERPNGVPYASCGLVWKAYGEKICGSKSIALAVDKRLMQTIDAIDNGVSVSSPTIDDVRPYNIQDLFGVFNTTWKEDIARTDHTFNELVAIAIKILEREIVVMAHKEEGERLVEREYENAKDKRLIILDQKQPWVDVLMNHPEPLFVVYPDEANDKWCVKAVKKTLGSFDNRKDLPAAWAGKSGKDLAKVSGVYDAYFCHNKPFFVVADSKEGAIALARLALL